MAQPSQHRICQGLGPASSLDPGVSGRVRTQAFWSLAEKGPGFPYSKRLAGHTSCVNALALSNGSGRWLASGGDDRHVLLWDLHQDQIDRPCRAYSGPRSNVFALAFSATNQYLYTGDTSNVIYEYDLSNWDNQGIGQPNAKYMQHQDSVRAISCHPERDKLFLSASEDGCIIMHDTRADSRLSGAQGTLQHDAEFTGVQYHPTMPHIFATSDSMGCVCLRDVRMAFGPLSSRRLQGVVQTYVTALSKQSSARICRPEASSICFDSSGALLAVTMLAYLPTIFTVSDPFPVAVCSGENYPDGTNVPVGEHTYSNSCTIKHGSFGWRGPHGEECYAGGSDDFRGYVWKIPPSAFLLENRREIQSSSWYGEELLDVIASAASATGSRYIPLKLSTPLCRLNGHRSIVNTALIHPHYPYVVTCGIERHIILHSVTPTSPGIAELSLSASEVRAPASSPRHRVLAREAMERDDGAEDSDDERTIALFDELLQNGGDTDLFISRSSESDI